MEEEKEEKEDKEKEEKEEVCEVFKVEKDGEEEIKEVCGTEEKKPTSKEEIKKENKQLRNILIGVGIVAIIFLLIFLFGYLASHFKYKGVKFQIVQEGELILYQTSLPVIYEGKVVPYNIYLRNDPRKLEKTVPASGVLLLLDDIVLNMSEFDCEGDQIIAIANLVQLYDIIGSNIIRDENASCDSEGRYTFLQIHPGNETSIEKTGPSCYNLNVNNCEILEVTERFMAGILVRVNIDET